MAEKKGARKTVGKARKGDLPKGLMKLYYVRKANGAYATKYEPVETREEQAADQPAS
jgi:hypothetical protein